jgi:hypothetical protein
MLQNLGRASGYSLLAVPVAAGALAWADVTLTGSTCGPSGVNREWASEEYSQERRTPS